MLRHYVFTINMYEATHTDVTTGIQVIIDNRYIFTVTPSSNVTYITRESLPPDDNTCCAKLSSI